MRSFLVIANADAGAEDTEALTAALNILRSEAIVEVAETSAPEELDEVLGAADSSQVIVVAGGDGSLHAVITALYRRDGLSDRTLGLLPLGTGNDFARSVDIPDDPAEAARLVIEGVDRPMSLLVDGLGNSGTVVVNNVHVGAGAQASRVGHVAKSALRKVKLGKLGYPIGAAVAAIKPRIIRVTVIADGKVINEPSQPIVQLAMGNGRDVGGGTTLNPEADPESHTIDVVLSRAAGPIARIAYAAHLARKSHHKRDDVLHLQAREITVRGEAFWCSADGELYGPEKQRTWKIQPNAYRLIVPN